MGRRRKSREARDSMRFDLELSISRTTGIEEVGFEVAETVARQI